MKTMNLVKKASYALAATMVFASCQKSDVSTSGNDTSGTSNVIAVSATQSATATSGTTADSVYLVQPCSRGSHRDSIAQSSLPTSAGTYLSTNYSGYTFNKAFAVKNSAGTVTDYVVVIYYNNNPVGLLFDASGNFERVLEQREKGDLNGAGFHHGGRFEHRDGLGRDSIALSALSATITTYFNTNYPGDTLVKAFQNRDSSIVVLSRNNGAFATVFTASGTYVRRDALHQRNGPAQAIALSALPSTAANYLATTYPNYVFEKAFSISQSGVLKGYVVIIDANNTKYAVEFDANGGFVHARTI